MMMTATAKPRWLDRRDRTSRMNPTMTSASNASCNANCQVVWVFCDIARVRILALQVRKRDVSGRASDRRCARDHRIPRYAGAPERIRRGSKPKLLTGSRERVVPVASRARRAGMLPVSYL